MFFPVPRNEVNKMGEYKYYLLPRRRRLEFGEFEVNKEKYYQAASNSGFDMEQCWRNSFSTSEISGKIIYVNDDGTFQMFPKEGLNEMSSAKEQFLREIENQGNVDEVTRMHAAYKSLGEDTYSSGTVIRTLKVFPNSGSWWYAAIKGIDGKWRMTGGKPNVSYPGGITWHQMKVWLASTGNPTTSLEVFGDSD